MKRQETNRIEKESHLIEFLESFENNIMLMREKNERYGELLCEYFLIVSLVGCDRSLERLTESEQDNRIILSLMSWMRKNLSDLTSLAEKYDCVRDALKSYLPRLQQFAEEYPGLQEIYRLYEQSFGGRGK